ncbi:MAG: undecaprenyl/decaprenyl-phosphate alpha-N-acetylglucosaminyl 1-phosphate transferase [Dethiobacter sp.]|jgi:UDP-GlcNAc:undecaprenyl-phosphate GlcNAc-1-phosphate transferase|nr:undecaprenyl/decaprenyl-phosphate alpha-N-acetylglucosaminyl 1-phosphate transferase [Dethiobacter sp.]
MQQYLLLFGIAFLVSLLITPWVASLAFRIGALDKPNKRKIHDHMMPRLGGLAVYAGFLVSAALLLDKGPKVTGLLLGGTVILIIGIADDIRGLSPKLKLVGQALAACIVIYFGIRVEFINNPFDGYFQLGILSIPFTIMWIVSVTNAVNLIDGLDGLASGVSTIALLTFSIIAFQMRQPTVSLLSIALAGSILGFLRYNFHPAKIFLGDSGSMFLGYMVSVLAVFGLLKGVTLIAFIVPIIILGVPIFDTCYAIFRRYRNCKPIFQADKLHIHHRLLRRGLSHRQAVLVIYCISLFFSVSALLMMRNIRLF